MLLFSCFSLLRFQLLLCCGIMNEAATPVSTFVTFAQFEEGLHSISRILLCNPCKFYQSLFGESSATLTRSFPSFGCVGWLKAHTKSYVQFFRTFQLFFGVSLLVTFAELLRIFACALSFHGVSQGRRKSGRAGRTEKCLGQCKLIKNKKIVNKYACLCSATILT